MTQRHDDPDDLLRLLSRLERLEALPRTGWIVCGVQHPESIAAHSYMVTLTALWLADALRARGQQVDVEALLRIALLHDVGEAMMTDLPRPVKRFAGADVLRQAEAAGAAHVLGQGAPASWRQAHQAYDQRPRSLEARLVKAADTIQMLAKALQYHAQRRGDVRRFFEDLEPLEAASDLPLIEEILAAIERRWREGDWWAADFD